MPVLSFWHKYSFDTTDDDGDSNQQNLDYGFVEVREIGGTSWQKLYFVTGISADWAQEHVDLSNYAGKNVDIRFRVDSNTDNQRSNGWLIDDISIAETLLPTLPYPFLDSMEAASAGNWHTSSWGLTADSYSGTYGYTDSPASWYAWDVYSSLIMANSIDLIGAVHPVLTFWHKHSFYKHSGYEEDRGEVWISTNNGQPGSWKRITDFRGTMSSYYESQIDLTPYVGLRNIRVKFEIHDTIYSANDNSDGWWIDSVRIGEDQSIPSYILNASGDDQTGQTGTMLSTAFEARVYDSVTGRPKSGMPVGFVVESGGGSLSTASVASDADGFVSSTLTLGDAGVNSVKATIEGTTESVIFSATGYALGQPKQLKKVSGDNQVNEINQALSNPLRVRVTDILGAPVVDVSVIFSINSGDGTLETTDPVVTDMDGYGSNNLTLGAVSGTTVVAVRSSGLASVMFKAHAVLSGGSLGDDDGDGMPNDWENSNGLNSQDASDGVLDVGDSDGLNNFQEFAQGTDPNDPDSDNDGMPDGWEVLYGLDPIDPSDAADDNDGDDATNLQEFSADTIPVFPRHFALAGATNESMDFYGLVTVDEVQAAIGDELAALDPQGIVCGVFRVSNTGEYGFMHVYRDDPITTGVDEGAEPGDELAFRIWDAGSGVELDATPDVISGTNPPTWTADRDSAYVNLNGAGEQVIPLQIGWNLISFSIKTNYYIEDVPGEGPPDVPMLTGTVHLNVVNIADVFESIDGLYDVIRSFDKNGAHTFDPALPSFSDMKYVAGGYGYWIKMNAAGNLILRGVRAKSTDSLSLHPGWNLIGYWHPAVQHTGSMPTTDFPIGTTQFISIGDIDEAIAEISGNYFVIRSYDIDGAHTYDPMLGSFNDLDYLGAGYGIWIKMKTVDILSYE